MKQINDKTLIKICSLSEGYSEEDIKKFYNVKQIKTSCYKNFKINDILFCIGIEEIKNNNKGKVIVVFKNLDLICRKTPYYDGDLDNLIFIKNQRKIQELIIQNYLEL